MAQHTQRLPISAQMWDKSVAEWPAGPADGTTVHPNLPFPPPSFISLFLLNSAWAEFSKYDYCRESAAKGPLNFFSNSTPICVVSLLLSLWGLGQKNIPSHHLPSPWPFFERCHTEPVTLILNSSCELMV